MQASLQLVAVLFIFDFHLALSFSSIAALNGINRFQNSRAYTQKSSSGIRSFSCLLQSTRNRGFVADGVGKFLQRTSYQRPSLTVARAIEGTGVFLVSPATIGFAVNTVLALFGLITQKYKKVLTLSGLLHAWFLGVLLWASLGFAGWSTGVLYLIMGSVATKIKQKEKEAKGIAGPTASF